MRKRPAVLAGILSGLTSVRTLGEAAAYPSLSGDDLQRLRGDVHRIGADFASVIKREQSEEGSITRQARSHAKRRT